MPKWLGFVVVVAVCTGLLGCANNNETQQARNVVLSVTPKPQTLSYGQSARVGDITVTLNSVRIIPPIQYVGPPDGAQYLAADISAQNETGSPYTLSTLLSASALDNEGRKYTPSTIPNDSMHGTIDGVIPAHGSVRGEVVFSMPTASAPYQIRFTQPLGNGSATWAAPLP